MNHRRLVGIDLGIATAHMVRVLDGEGCRSRCSFPARGHTVFRVSSQKAADLRRFLSRHAKSNGIDADTLARLPLSRPAGLAPLVLPGVDRAACDDPPACTCRPTAGARAGRGGHAREHDQGCAQLVFPNLITHVATTDATVTDTQMTAAICDDLTEKSLPPGRHYLDSGYLKRRPDGLGADHLGHRADRAAAGRHLRPGPRRG